ncbi:MaoC/PaaZ C-terminal domain-containing protein [Comamonadaceae bacterium G21597-S1]|nr:MaoC/PaaZ C-terminal domain-containing protein [Comamonadaceae bacterium G21597-S1]
MAIEYEKLKAWVFPDVEQTYTTRDTILYALGLGFGADPMNQDQLRFVYEHDMQVVPTMPVVLARPAGMWPKNPETGINWKKMVAGEQDLLIHHPLPAEGTVISQMSITEILDKGADKGAVLYYTRKLMDKHTGMHYSSVNGSLFLRGDGGFGGPVGPSPKPNLTPERAPDLECSIQTMPQQALIYRLSGDYNPLHADPEFAAAAGYARPILHGLCSFGIAGHALLRALCGYRVGCIKRIAARFSSPVFPGETICTQIWRDGDNRAAFRSVVPERKAVVVSNGLVEITNNQPR